MSHNDGTGRTAQRTTTGSDGRRIRRGSRIETADGRRGRAAEIGRGPILTGPDGDPGEGGAWILIQERGGSDLVPARTARRI
jgi:hypothetical protein